MSVGNGQLDSGQVDSGRVEGWLLENVPASTAPFSWQLVGGGRSNLTYLVRDGAGRQVVVRRPPAHVDTPGAHDVAREYRIQHALSAGSDVRVPGQLAFCGDVDVLGAPFYVMQFVDGVIVRDRAAARALSTTARTTASRALVDQLATVHGVRPDDVGLGDLGRPDGYLERQLRRWSTQIDDDAPARGELTHAHELLARRLPPQDRTALLHGDYRLDNVVLSDSGDVLAVLDWELSTQGDPLADLGWLLLYWRPPPELTGVLPGGSELDGFADGAELAGQYRDRTGADLSQLPYYLGFAAWRLALITVGVHRRYRAGAGAGEALAVDELPAQVEALAHVALTHLECS